MSTQPIEFRIADTFTDSLARLTADEQKAVKMTAFDLQVNPGLPSLQFHKLSRAKDSRFASVRVSLDLRVIVHRTPTSLLLCYVGHHDAAYAWAERRKLETHPATGAAQLVEIRETVEEIKIPRYVEVEQRLLPTLLFAGIADDVLLSYGVPGEWLGDVRVANEDTLLALVGHLPSEAAEALLELATGGRPQPAKQTVSGGDPFAHPDAQRRFRVMESSEELERALAFPWEKWTVFLHPMQRTLVERDYGGAARVAGSAGTGKTIVALHRAVFLARTNPDARVLLTTFSDSLASALRLKLRRLIGDQPRLGERIEVQAMDVIGRRLYEAKIGKVTIASRETMRKLLRDVAAGFKDNMFSERFLLAEWEQVVDAWHVVSWETYRDVARLGRKTRLPEKSRAMLWSIFGQVRCKMHASGLLTHDEMFTLLAAKIERTAHPVFDYAVVDESQDISVAQLRFLAALGMERPNALFFAGDIGQRIFQQPFSWKAIGVDVRGRSSTLRINYRTSHQIRTRADRLLGPELKDVDGIAEKRRDTTSTFNGPHPEVLTFSDQGTETQAVAKWLCARMSEGVAAGEIGVFVRSDTEMHRAQETLKAAGVPYNVLDERVGALGACASLATMHLVKGLEFRTVVVMACDDEVIPLQERIAELGDEADLEEVYASERQLLYVACTRARDHLLVTATDPASEFLDDLRN